MRLFYVVLFLALVATAGCSHYSSSARQQRAYAKYVRKSQIAHQKRQVKFREEKAKIPQPNATTPSEPQVTTQTSEEPQAVPSDSNNQ